MNTRPGAYELPSWGVALTFYKWGHTMTRQKKPAQRWVDCRTGIILGDRKRPLLLRSLTAYWAKRKALKYGR